MNKKNLNTIVPIVALILALALLSVIIIDLMPLVREILHNSHNESNVIDYIHAYGAKAVPILIGLQFLFTLIPFLPSAPVQILAGLCYGILYGPLICIVGIIASNSLLFYFARQSGNLLESSLHRKSQEKHNPLQEKLKNIKKPEIMVFLLYVNPIIPSSILPFLFAKSKISYPKYLLSMTAASIPITFLYSWLGERVSKGDYKVAIILACVIAVIIGLLFIFRKKINV